MKLFDIIIYAVLALIVLSVAFRGYDSTDDAENNERSGMHLYHDYGTGCDYLAVGSLFSSDLQPRLDSDGNHVCNQSTER